MGYTTEFTGYVAVEPPLNRHEVAYLNRFADSRRFVRHSGPYQTEGDEYQGRDTIDYNRTADGQPGLWCNWTVSDDGTLIGWNGAEKFYDSVEWMRYLIDTFLSSTASLKTELDNRVEDRYYADEFGHFTFDHVVSGEIEASGERGEDRWRLSVRTNIVERVEVNATASEAATATIPAEPADKTLVGWFAQNGEPYVVFYRADSRTDSEAETYHWFNADQYNGPMFEAWTWTELCEEMAELDGPHTLTLVRADVPAVAS